jgi:hypothetical protein
LARRRDCARTAATPPASTLAAAHFFTRRQLLALGDAHDRTTMPTPARWVGVGLEAIGQRVCPARGAFQAPRHREGRLVTRARAERASKRPGSAHQLLPASCESWLSERSPDDESLGSAPSFPP